jgi:uncharacterized protein YjbI with pentapeptide repeats
MKKDPRLPPRFAAVCGALISVALADGFPSPVRADVYRTDTGQTIPGTQGITPAPDADFSNAGKGLNLNHADLAGYDLSRANFSRDNLSNARFSKRASAASRGGGGSSLVASITGRAGGSSQVASTVTDANFAQADVRYTDFSYVTSFTPAQLESTRSYQRHDLTGIRLEGLDLTGWDFSSQNLRDVDLLYANLTDVILKGAKINRTQFVVSTGLTSSQIYSTASYRNRDLSGVTLYTLDLTGWNFDHQNLSHAYLRLDSLSQTSFRGANLTGADFYSSDFSGPAPVDLTGASITDAFFGYSTGLTAAQLESTRSFRKHNLSGIGFDGLDLSGWNLSGQNLSQARFCSANLSGTDFNGAVIKGADLSYTDGFTYQQLCSTASYAKRNLSGVSLSGLSLPAGNFHRQNLSSAQLNYADCTGTDFSSANLSHASFDEATLTNANFKDAVITDAWIGSAHDFTFAQLASTRSYQKHDLRGVIFYYSDLTGWSFAGQKLIGADFTGADLTNADFAGALVAGASFRKSLSLSQLQSTASYARHNLAGIGLEQLNLATADFRRQDLRNASFNGSDLTQADFGDAVIKGCNFDNASFSKVQLEFSASFKRHDLAGIDLSGLDLAGGDLHKQNLTGAQFQGSSLTAADLTSANLRNADFTGADLRYADLSHANLKGADFAFADLRNAAGPVITSACTIRNAILPDGSLRALLMNGSDRLVIRDDTPAITICGPATFAITARIDIQLDDAWSTPVVFAPNILMDLGGYLQLDAASDPAGLVGKTFQLFTWNTTLAADNCFYRVTGDSRLTWDFSNLYLDGTVTATGLAASSAAPSLALSTSPVPEPLSAALLLPAAFLLLLRSRRPA